MRVQLPEYRRVDRSFKGRFLPSCMVGPMLDVVMPNRCAGIRLDLPLPNSADPYSRKPTVTLGVR